MNLIGESTERSSDCAAASGRLPFKSPAESLDRVNVEPKGQPRNRSQDRRTHPRLSVDADSTLLLVSRGLSLPGRILDLSLDGCCLRTRERCAVPARARVEVAFKVNGIAFRFLGVIQWTDARHCTGIRFVNMIARRREQLAEVIGEMETARAIKSAQREAAQGKTQVAGGSLSPQASDSVMASAAPQTSIRQRQQAKPEAAQRLESHHQPLHRGDRRAHTRHSVDTTAAILLIKTGARLRGRIVDLSTGGCRVLCDQRFPVGIYTRVETEFNLDGLSFRLGGVVQAIHNQRTVGIRFLDMSGRKRAQIEQLIEEIEERKRL